ncbi:MAG: NAD(P)-binding domain-containing protein, partial [Candidatus Bathyarchaeia archaeon]
MKIGIIGSGIVGQATGIGLIAKGHQVKFYDIDENKLLTLKNNGYDTNNILDDVIDFADTVFVSVPTPTVGQKIDLKIIIDCSKSIAKAIKRFGKYVVVTYRSTIPPQTSRTILLPVLEKFSGLNAGIG